MEQHNKYWQQFAKSGDPVMYLAYKQSRDADTMRKRHGND